jgi:hypothetical protein
MAGIAGEDTGCWRSPAQSGCGYGEAFGQQPADPAGFKGRNHKAMIQRQVGQPYIRHTVRYCGNHGPALSDIAACAHKLTHATGQGAEIDAVPRKQPKHATGLAGKITDTRALPDRIIA